MGGQGSIFISYSHRDEDWKDRLVSHLQVLELQGLLDVWDDRRIGAGEDWLAAIDAAMATAQAAVLLVSADFLTSKFILGQEVPPLLERRASQGLRVIPVIVRPCAWRSVGWLASIQARPRDGRALSSGDDHQIDADLAELATEIHELLADPQPTGPAAESPTADLKLKLWDPPDYPIEPYPLLLPYRHPDLLAGREQELADVRRELAGRTPIVGLYAPSGAGKSSLLNAGLVPALRATGAPVALDDHPHEPGLAARLLGQLLMTADGSRPRVDSDPRAFVEHLRAVRRLAKAPALLVLDQFEDVLATARAGGARAAVGLLLAATVAEQLAGEEPLCRWLLAHRRDFHGALKDWLADVLTEARAEGLEVADLPFELSRPDRFQAWRLRLLGSPPPGDDRIDVPLAVFRAAIEKPLALNKSDGTPRYRRRFVGDGAERLARAFAKARLEQREAPLTPELQVVLAHLEKGAVRSAADGAEVVEIAVGEDPESLIGDALDAHLRTVLRGAFPAGSRSAARRGRTRALLALRELAGAQGRTDEGIPASRLAAAIGEDGGKILEKLAAADARLIVDREDADDVTGKRYVLSHDRLAEAVVRAVEEEGAKLDVDSELLRLRKLVALNAELFREGETRQATDLDRQQYRRVGDNVEALLWDEERLAWWQACVDRLRKRRRRRLVTSGIALLILSVVGFQVWRWWDRKARQDSWLVEVSAGQPARALVAIRDLIDDGVDPRLLRDRFAERQGPDLLQVFEAVPEDMDETVLTRTRFDAARTILPSLNEGDSAELELVGVLAWVFDDIAIRDPSLAEEARGIRTRMLQPFDPPAPPPASDPSWADIPGGTFRMGSDESVGDRDEQPAHEVTVSPFRMLVHEVTLGEFRRLFPGHGDGPDDHPAVDVNWYQAYAYAAWLGGRLPTEAEWEYAARANCDFDYCGPEGEKASLDDVAWHSGNSGRETHPACQKKRNFFRLCDMIGNVWEWTVDWYGPYGSESVTDPWGPSGGGGRVFRGGSYWDAAGGARSANRFWDDPGFGDGSLGFRVLLPRP